jgi:DNA polymerase III alpha subunit
MRSRAVVFGKIESFVLLSLENETGISNVIVNPDLYEKYRVAINREEFLRVEGVLQNRDHTGLAEWAPTFERVVRT